MNDGKTNGTKFVFNQKAIKYLADIVNNTNLTEVEYKCGDVSIKFSKKTETTIYQPAPSGQTVTHTSIAPTAEAPACASTFITAPVVGRAYLAPKPGDPAFAKIGDKIEKGQIVCIIEAMKVMNNVKATTSGTVAEIFIKDGDPIEFGQKLMRLE